MLRPRPAAAVLAVVFWLPSLVHAWSAAGHRVIANIAYDRLDDEARAKIVGSLRRHEDFDKRFKERLPTEIRAGSPEEDRWIFLQASLWPDLIRSVPKYSFDTWHYINIPYFMTPLDKAALEKTIKPNTSFDVPAPLTDEAKKKLNCVQALKLSLQTIARADSSDADKAIAYCWIMHIAGDMHQPMHSTALITRGRFQGSEGDRGGNSIKTLQSRNLHAFWDGLIGGEQTLNAIRGRAAEILASPEYKKAADASTKNLDPGAWAHESHTLACEFAYDRASILAEVALRETEGQLTNVDLPVEYRKEAGRHAQRRVAEAGYRLAEILKNARKN
jgi:hypothetical protein